MNIAELNPHPLAARLRKLEPQERAALKASMEERGFDPADPVIVFNDPKLGWTILDGIHRRKVAMELGLDRIPFREFSGDMAAAARYVALKQLGRRNNDKSQRAGVVAVFRKELGLTLEKAAEVAGVSVSQMEKAGAVAAKSPQHSARVLSGELTVNQAAKQTKRQHVPTHTNGEDPWVEIQRTMETMTAAEDALKEWARNYMDPLLERRGAERLRQSLVSMKRTPDGKLSIGLTLIEGMMTTIRRNKPKGKCKTCNGAGCQDCDDLGYTTPHEEAMARNQRNATK